MGRVTEYELLGAADGGELTSKVNERLTEGWQLYGSPFSRGASVHQAVVRTSSAGKRMRKTSED
jgi:hypothetical protein